MVRILVIHYSQTGQLTRVLHSFLGPLEDNPDVTIDWRELKPRIPFAFPWRFMAFLDVFPESVYLDPSPIEPCGIPMDTNYDLVIFGYQVWFLSPSLPAVAFLKSPEALILRGRRVITVIGCRNMWVIAQSAILGLFRSVGARHTDNVVLTDEGPLWATFITTPWWLLTGNKGPLFGLLPKAGISDSAIHRAARFGHALNDVLPQLSQDEEGPFLRGLQAATVKPLTLLGERIGYRSFRLWGRVVRAAGPPGSLARRSILLVYLLFLITAILAVLPLTSMAMAIAVRISRRLREEVAALELPSGSGTDRLRMYDRSA